VRRGYLALLRDHRDYRYLYLARTVSLLGDWFNLLAILALLRELRGDSAGAVGWVLILKLLPIFLLGPVAGVVADRYSRKRVMVASDLGRFLAVGALLLAGALPGAALPLVYALTALQIGLAAFFEPARTASIPNVVPEEDLAAANALGAVTWSVMFTLGAGLGGLVTWLWGWQAAIALDALTYLVSAALVARVRLPRRERKPPASTDLWTLLGLREVLAGARFVFSRPGLPSLILVKAGWGIAGAITLILTLYGQSVYSLAGSPEIGVSFLYVARAAGVGLGPLIARRLARDDPGRMRRLIGWSFLLASACYLLFASARDPWTGAALVVLSHIGGSTVWVFSTVLLQKEVPDEFRGRTFATELGLATATYSISTFLFGWALDGGLLSLRQATVALALSLLLPGLLWLASLRRLGRPRLPEADGAL
jgi:MFS family permease